MREDRWIGVWSEVELRVGWNDSSGGRASVSEIRRRGNSGRGLSRGRRERGRVFPLNCLEFGDTVPMFVFLLDPQNLTSNRRVEKLFPTPNLEVPVRNTNRRHEELSSYYRWVIWIQAGQEDLRTYRPEFVEERVELFR